METPMDGLTPELVLRLNELGVHTVSELVEMDGLLLSQELPMPLTRVKRLQQMARRVRTQRAMSTDGQSDRDLLPTVKDVLRPALQSLELTGISALEPELLEESSEPEAEAESRKVEPQPLVEPEADAFDSSGPFA